MVQLFLDDIGYTFTENEIEKIITNTNEQRAIMSRVVQVLAGKIVEEQET